MTKLRYTRIISHHVNITFPKKTLVHTGVGKYYPTPVYHGSLLMSQLRRWCFTMYEDQEGWLEPSAVIELFKARKTKFLVFQKELCPETQRPHYQGYAEFASPIRLNSLKKLHRTAHWTSCKGTAQENYDYCTKLDSRSDGPWEYGTMSRPGTRNDLKALATLAQQGSTMREALEAMPETYGRHYRMFSHVRSMFPPKRPEHAQGKIAVHLLIGEPGSGKTYAARKAIGDDSWEMPIRSGKDNWFDGYDGQINVLLNEFEGQMPLTTLNSILEPGVIKVPCKGGHVWWYPLRIFITSNSTPDKWYNFEGRESRRTALYRRIHYVWYFDGKNEPVRQDGLDYFGIREHQESMTFFDFEAIPSDEFGDLV